MHHVLVNMFEHGAGNERAGDPRYWHRIWINTSDDIHGDHEPQLFESEDAPPLGRFPVEALPAPIRDIVEELSAWAQVDPAMPAAFALGTISACVGKGVKVVELPGLEHYPTLILVIHAESGERKSSVTRTLLRPVDEKVAEWAEVYSKPAKLQLRLLAKASDR